MNKIILFVTVFAFSFSTMGIHGSEGKNDDKYCAKLRDGKIVVMYEGNPITSDIRLENGTLIKPDGTVIKKDGSKMNLTEGQCIQKDGNLCFRKNRRTK